MFRITQAAAAQVKTAAQQGGADDMALRMAAVRNSDGSFDYRMGFDEVKEDDIQFQSEGVQIVMAPEYIPLLDETVMDFVELDDGEHQFIFVNPKDSNYVPPQGQGAG
jgi:iron-sulfur cluster assembly protein